MPKISFSVTSVAGLRKLYPFFYLTGKIFWNIFFLWSLQEAQKRMKIKLPPRVLALHLKRFKYIEQLGRYKKLSYRVVFPLELKLCNTVDGAPGSDAAYNLFAVVVHIGRYGSIVYFLFCDRLKDSHSSAAALITGIMWALWRVTTIGFASTTKMSSRLTSRSFKPFLDLRGTARATQIMATYCFMNASHQNSWSLTKMEAPVATLLILLRSFPGSVILHDSISL